MDQVYALIFNCSFSVMIKSWALTPDDRPTFEKLSSTLDRLLQLSAGYLELGMQLQRQDQEEFKMEYQ